MSENFNGIFAAVTSVLKADLSLDVKGTISHAKKNLDDNGVGSAFFGSTGCGQLISVREKKEFIDALSKENFKEKILIGTSCNSLNDTIDIMKHSVKNGFKVVIYANHLLRASYFAMNKTLDSILKNGRSFESEKNIEKVSNLLKYSEIK